MKVNYGSASKKILWVLSFGFFVNFACAFLTSCASGDKKEKSEEVGSEDGDKKKKKKKSKKDAAKKKDKDKDKAGGDAGADAKDPM